MTPLPNPARRHILLALASLPLTGVARAAGPKSGEIGMLEAINQAGRQRMLSQRVFFDEAIRSGRSKRSELDYLDNNVAVSSENILQVMDKLTELYATSS
ncbi:MAG: hypothetical protein RJA63_815 [Pseudomonadota bacterium]|jgi:hypothetical protein